MHIFVIAVVQNRIVGSGEEIFHRVPQRRDVGRGQLEDLPPRCVLQGASAIGRRQFGIDASVTDADHFITVTGTRRPCKVAVGRRPASRFV